MKKKKKKKSVIKGRKHCEKRRNCSLQAIFHNVFHNYIFLVSQNVILSGNGLK